MDRMGCFFLTARTLDDLAKRFKTAEALGYDIAGLPHIAGRDALATLAMITPQLTRMQTATGIVPIWTRTPVAMAQEIATIHEGTGGRFLAGLGIGHKDLVEHWHGTPFHHPLAAMRDYLTIVRTALREGSVSYDGEVYRAHFGFLGFTPQDVPLLVGGLGPKMLELTGELADGAILWMSSQAHIRDVVMPHLAIGAVRAGREASAYDVFACMFAAPGPDRASGRDAIRRQLLAYVQLPFYRNMLVASGFAADLEHFDAHIGDGDLPSALAALSDAMIDEIAVTGSAEEIADTLRGFRNAGCTIPGIGVVGGYEGYAGTEASLRAVMDARELV